MNVDAELRKMSRSDEDWRLRSNSDAALTTVKKCLVTRARIGRTAWDRAENFHQRFSGVGFISA
jgi:hypothetical protein